MKTVFLMLPPAVLFFLLLGAPGCARHETGPNDHASPSRAVFSSIRTGMTMGQFKLKIYDYRKGKTLPPGTVYYYLHGQGGNAASWEDLDLAFLNKYFQNESKTNDIVVSVTAGPEMMLIPKNSSPQSGLEEAFIKDVVEKLSEQKHWTEAKKVLIGISMGGTSGSYIFFNNPEFFDAAIFISAGNYPVSVFATDDELKTFLAKNEHYRFKEKILAFVGKSPRLEAVKSVLSIQKRFFGGEKDWEKYFIFNTLKTADRHQKVYISTGRLDSLGLYSGSLFLAQKAKKAGYDVTYDELDGGHVAINQKDVIDFVKSISM